MRTVYLDVLVTVNIFIDFFLILCTKMLLHIRCGFWRMIAGAVLGGFFSLIALMPQLPAGVNILADVALAAPVIFTAFGFCSPKTYLKRLTVYFLCSFFFCGIMIFIYTSFKPKGMEIYNNVIYFNISPVVLIILTLICYYAIKFSSRLTKSDVGKTVCEISVFGTGGSVSFNAMVDTGCEVREPFSGDYVIIAEKELLKSVGAGVNDFRVIPFGSMGGNGIIRGFRPQRVTIDGSDAGQSLYIGICENILKGDVKAIVPYAVVKK